MEHGGKKYLIKGQNFLKNWEISLVIQEDKQIPSMRQRRQYKEDNIQRRQYLGTSETNF